MRQRRANPACMIDDILSAGDAIGDQPSHSLTPLEPNYVNAIRIVFALNCAVLIAGAMALDFFVLRKVTFGVPLLSLVIIGLSAYLVIRVPPRRFAAWGYGLDADQLRIVRGVLFHADTIVPFVRVQHIDVSRGPIERMTGTATLTVHTAGNHNSAVSLPGLAPSTAEAIRDRVRAEIRTDFA
jgi:uncharacterized protein